MKRKLSLLLVMVMMLSMVLPVFAAGGLNDKGSITVDNPKKETDYTLYKIFDATWAGDKVAYTLPNGSKWTSLVKGEGSPFDVDEQGNVSEKENADVIGWLQAITPPSDADKDVKSGDPLKWGNLDFGYYLITTSYKSADDPIQSRVVTVTNVNADVTVIDKNDKPGWDEPEDPEDPNDPNKGKNVSDKASGPWGPTSTAEAGDTVYYKINAYAPKYNGDKQVYEYVFTDTLDASLTYNDNLKVKFKGEDDNLDDEQYKVESKVLDDGTTVITVTVYVYEKFDKDDKYPAEAELEMNFTATANKDVVETNKNKADMNWTEFDPIDPEDPNPEEPDPKDPPPEDPPESSETETYVYGLNIDKIDGKDKITSLPGAKFRLWTDGAEGLVEVPVYQEGGKYRVGIDKSAAGVDIVTNTEGQADIFGLDANKNYYLEEVEAPDGYNLLVDKVKFVILQAAKTDIADYEVVAGNNHYITRTIENNSGTELPETGGIGTTIFYVVGGLIMFISVVLLVTRKKMSAN